MIESTTTERRWPQLLNAREAVEYQAERFGRVCFGRDALYALVRQGKVPVVRNGSQRLWFPRNAIDQLLEGSTQEN